jgi:hypothetical protein
VAAVSWTHASVAVPKVLLAPEPSICLHLLIEYTPGPLATHWIPLSMSAASVLLTHSTLLGSSLLSVDLMVHLRR